MFTTVRKPTGQSQEAVALACSIDRKRYIAIEHGRTLPDPHELIMLDRHFQQGGVLIMKYCSCNCPAGREIGLSFDETTAVVAGMRVFKCLTDAQHVRPELEAILEDGEISPQEQTKFQQIMQPLLRLSRAITSLGMQKEKSPVLAHRR